jgi:hypothetical protein
MIKALGKWLIGVASVLVAVVVLWLITWAIAAILGFGPTYLIGTKGLIQWTLFPGGLPTPFFWILVAFALSILLLIWAYDNASGSNGSYNDYGRRQSSPNAAIAWILTVVMILGGFSLGIVKGVTMGILASDYYLTTTSIEVKDSDAPPAILEKYVDAGLVEVPIKDGDLSNQWVPRVASMTGALNVLSKTSGSINNSELMTDTITYLYGEGDKGAWTAIRNSGGQQDIYGISSWNGTGDADRIQTCRFDGDYDLNKNFGGMWGKNLWNSVANTYPSFYYDESDMWGYCDGSEPVIVIPGVRLTYTDMRSVDAPAGVVTIRGSKSGEPVLDMATNVKPGDFPGPVYPQRLVNSQRAAVDWTAGYWQSVNEHFGFDDTGVASQAGNSSNFLLKSAENGRLYWVTPMKPQSSGEQTLIAYSIIPADEVSTGLNQQTVSVLNEDDPRKVNLDDLFSFAQDAVCNLPDPNFCTDTPKGQIVEFLPITDTKWQAFGEIAGRVKYLVDLEVSGSSIKTQTTTLETDSGETKPNPSPNSSADPSENATCDNPSNLTDKQLADCLASLANELAGRGTEG